MGVVMCVCAVCVSVWILLFFGLGDGCCDVCVWVCVSVWILHILWLGDVCVCAVSVFVCGGDA